jgi:hypothetical protein
VHKVEPLKNVQLSARFWIDLLDRPLPAAPAGSGGLVKLGSIALREMPGLALLAAYFLVLPALLPRGSKAVGALRSRLGRGRYVLTSWLFLTMALLPLKMICRWLFNMNYFVAIPEYYFNI